MSKGYSQCTPLQHPPGGIATGGAGPLSQLLPVLPWKLYLWQQVFLVINQTLYQRICVVSYKLLRFGNKKQQLFKSVKVLVSTYMYGFNRVPSYLKTGGMHAVPSTKSGTKAVNWKLPQNPGDVHRYSGNPSILCVGIHICISNIQNRYCERTNKRSKITLQRPQGC